MVNGVVSGKRNLLLTGQQISKKRSKQHIFKVSPEDASKRIDVYLSEKLPDFTRSRLKVFIKADNVFLNKHPAKPGFRIRSGDILTLDIPEQEPLKAKPEAIPLEIIYSDNSVIIINKPVGLVVHAGTGRTSGTLVNALLYHFEELSKTCKGLRPGIVHRLDKDTSGVMIIAKNDLSHERLGKQFKEHSIKRRYIALTWGIVKSDKGTIDMPIGRHISQRKKMSIRTRRGRRAVTYYKVLKRFGNFSLLELSLETGRTHQIRVHLSHMNHPVVGDQTYGKRTMSPNLPKPVIDVIKAFKRQALHAAVLGFIHPETKEYMEFSTPLPDDMKVLIDILKKHLS
jgi:23S rRNA pseudouridine1911/1915/1917 synthase